jgi:AcrR family transcriptional regulator
MSNMQIQKDKIEKRILVEAEKEFSNKDFSNASIRKIAVNASVSTSNIYNYFKNKDELFVRIVKPTICIIDKYLDDLESGREHKNPANWSFKSHLLILESLADFIDGNRSKLKLAAFHANGSSLENYKEQLIEKYTRISFKCMKESKQLYPDLKADISKFFAHNIASLWLNIISEILMHDIQRGEMLGFLREVMLFMFYGYEGLTEYDFSKMKPKPLFFSCT